MTGSDIMNKLLEYSTMNPKKFSEKIGLLRPQAIYDIQNGKTKNISPSMVDKIISVFPEVDRGWLLTGEGEMLKEGWGELRARFPHSLLGGRGCYGWRCGAVRRYDHEPIHRSFDSGVPGLYGCREPVRRFDDAAVPERTDHHPQRVEREFYRFRQRLSGHHVQRQPDGQIPASGIGCRSRSLHLRKQGFRSFRDRTERYSAALPCQRRHFEEYPINIRRNGR